MYRRSLSDVRTRACARFDVHHVVHREQMPRLLERLIEGGFCYLKCLQRGASIREGLVSEGGFYLRIYGILILIGVDRE